MSVSSRLVTITPPPGDATPPLAMGVAITAVVAFAVISWVVLGAYILHLPSYFAAFLLTWYWASVQKSDFTRLPSAILGALCGLGLAWAMRSLSGAFGMVGLAVAAVLIALAVLADIQAWMPLVVNPCTFLFLTVASIPPIIQVANFIEIAGSLLIGTGYLSLIVWIALAVDRIRQKAVLSL